MRRPTEQEENERMAPIEGDRERDLLASAYRELGERHQANGAHTGYYNGSLYGGGRIDPPTPAPAPPAARVAPKMPAAPFGMSKDKEPYEGPPAGISGIQALANRFRRNMQDSQERED